MKGRWYRAASGRLMLAYDNNRTDNIAIMKLCLINFLLRNFLLSIKYNKSPKLKNIVFNKIFRDMKKFKKRAINDTKIMPCNDIFSISFVFN